METRHSLIRGDFWLQTILGMLIIVCTISVVGIIWAMMLLMPFGAWQVFSGLVLGVAYKDAKRLRYLVLRCFYFLTWEGIVYFTNDKNNAFLIPYGIVAVCLGVYYYTITYFEYKNKPALTPENTINENILDA